MSVIRKIPFSKVVCDGEELNQIQDVLASGWLTTAGKAMEFEHRIAEAVGARHACAVNSCTAALHLALEAIGIGPGDKVLVPTLTFTATAEVIRYLGADPVFADVEYGTGLLTPEIVDQACQQHPGIKAVVVVHFGGQAARMLDQSSSQRAVHPIAQEAHTLNPQPSTPSPGLVSICRKHGLRVIEDAAHAFPTRRDGAMVGSFGDATCFSFYANKTITTGEGGMLVTGDPAIYSRAKIMRLHGIDRDIWNRFTSDKPSWEYDVVAPGFKYNMPDINAAIGLAQLERAEQMRKERQRCFEFYLKNLAVCDWLDLPRIDVPLEDHSCHLFWVVLNRNAPVVRNRFIGLLAEAGIGTSVHYKPLHRMTYYRERYDLRPEDYPEAERHWKGCVSLPVYPSLSDDELGYVVEQVKRCADQARPS
jgi:dTDP-4-amino-4,6-dideoxygalactose transaminase